jgi:N-methylhydantoinase B
MHVGGGSGYGDPLARMPTAVAADVGAGIISEQTARDGYGVVLTAGQADLSATDARRAELREDRRQWPRELLSEDVGVLAGRTVAVRRGVASSRLATFDQWVHHNPAVQLVEYADPESGELLRTELVVDHQQDVMPQGSPG